MSLSDALPQEIRVRRDATKSVPHTVPLSQSLDDRTHQRGHGICCAREVGLRNIRYQARGVSRDMPPKHSPKRRADYRPFGLRIKGKLRKLRTGETPDRRVPPASRSAWPRRRISGTRQSPEFQRLRRTRRPRRAAELDRRSLQELRWAERVVITWLYQSEIQLRVRFGDTGNERRRGYLYPLDEDHHKP
jgi:hypothetical protein